NVNVRLYSGNNLDSFKLVYRNPKIKIDFSKQSHMVLKRSLNKDANAAEKSAETALKDGNYQKLKKASPADGGEKKKQSSIFFKIVDSALTTIIGLAAIGLGGVVYNAWYEWNEIHKVELAFKKPDPSLNRRIREFLKREDLLEKIQKAVEGHAPGKYLLLVGERGTGKTQLILNAMQKINQHGVVFAEAHSDCEIFKVRLGKALKYTYRQDYIGQLFAIEAPERGSALLDVEKALNVIEAVAIKYHKKHRRPLVLIINNIHAFKNEGLLELLQQRAESWAATEIVTMRDASKMEVEMIRDLELEEAISLLKTNRPETEVVLKEIVEQIGGRKSYLEKLAKEPDIYATAKRLENEERIWIINQIGLIPDFEESAFDNQKYAAYAWKLIRAIVKSPNNTVPKLANVCERIKKIGQGKA
ncbi:12562_t:CDS:2, partial [Racocetra persica]